MTWFLSLFVFVGGGPLAPLSHVEKAQPF